MTTPPFTIYAGDREQKSASAESIGKHRLFQTPDPSSFIPSRELVDALNVALHLGQPLLLTGEPGTGKTQFAYSVAWELGFESPLKFETKSNSESRDLFYTYNSIGRFHAAQTNEGSQQSVDYLSYNALGLAILLANDPESVSDLLPTGFEHTGGRRSVVLIDEVDKAPRDFPNDILNEVEGMYFRIPELGNRAVRARDDLHPIVIITSNSERHLPDAFLRRCIYHHIEFPDRDTLEQIVLAHFDGDGLEGTGLLQDAVSLFFQFRAEPSIRKKPATAELLGWLHAVRRKLAAETPQDIAQAFESTLGCIAKTPEGQEAARSMVRQWATQNKP